MLKKTAIIFAAVVLFKLLLIYLNYVGDESPELHAEILKYFTAEDIVRGAEYSRSGSAVAALRLVLFSAAIFLFAVSRLPGKLEEKLSEITGGRFFLSSVLFIAIFFTVITILTLPFSYYISFVNEHAYGFSNMTSVEWILRKMKSFLITTTFISIAGGAALQLWKRFSFKSIVIIPVAGVLISLFIIIIYPMAVLPLFYDITEVMDPALRNRVTVLAERGGYSIDGIYVIDESRYSNHTNAFFVGFGSAKKIYLYDTLLANHTMDEAISVLAHEMGHSAHDDNLKGAAAGLLLGTAGLAILLLLLTGAARGRGVPPHSVSLIPYILILYIIIVSFTDPAEMAISRYMERGADRYSLELTRNPWTFISSEIKLARENRSRLDPHPAVVFFRYTHPPVIERIKIGEEIVFELMK